MYWDYKMSDKCAFLFHTNVDFIYCFLQNFAQTHQIILKLILPRIETIYDLQKSGYFLVFGHMNMRWNGRMNEYASADVGKII